MVQKIVLSSASDAQIASALPGRLIQVLGAEIADRDLDQLQSQTELLTVPPGQCFWYSDDCQPGVYIVLAGKFACSISIVNELPL
jgi:hypothetical protein